MNGITCSVSGLDRSERSAFERVLGQHLTDDQSLKIEVVESVGSRPFRPRPPITGVPQGGQYEGRLVVPDDFDEPLEELREYME